MERGAASVLLDLLDLLDAPSWVKYISIAETRKHNQVSAPY